MSIASMYPRSRLPRPLWGIFFFAVIVVVELLAGAVVGLGNRLLDILLIGGLFGLFLLGLPTVYTIWILILLVFFVVGQAIYFGGLGQASWVPYGIGLLLYFKLPGAINAQAKLQPTRSTPLVWPVLLFILAIFLSIVVNTPSPFPTVAGSKNYVALWSIFFLLALGAIPATSIDRMWRFFFVIAAFQIPLVAYQYFFVAPSRTVFGSTLGARWDSIVGGFGGDPLGGGASGSMALFLSMVAFLGIALCRRKLLKTRWLLLLLAAALVCVGLAEVKVVAVLIPIGLAVALAMGFRRNALLTIALVPLGIVAIVGVFYAYSSLHYKDGRTARTPNPVDMAQRSFSYTLDPNLINYQTGEMGRTAALSHWWKENVGVDPVRTFVGHGPGASRGARIFGVGDVARKYPFYINRSAAAQLLWDVGVLGLLAFVMILSKGALLAFKAANSPDCPVERAAFLEATSAGLLMMVAMLPYSREVIEVPAVGVLMMFLLGFASLNWQLHGYRSGPNRLAYRTNLV